MGYRDEARYMILKYVEDINRKRPFSLSFFSASKSTKSSLFILLKVALLKVIVMLPHCKFSSLLFIRTQPEHLEKNKEKANIY
jgi:hypothetical protein